MQALPAWLIQKDNALVIIVHAQPGAKRSAVVGLYGNKLKIAVATPPVDGKANKAIAEFIAKTLDLSKSSVTLISGQTCREKRFLITGVSPEVCVSKLSPAT